MPDAMAPPDIEPSYTPREFAALEKRAVKSVYDLIRDGKVYAYKVGGQYRIPASEVRRIRSGGAA